jgi:serine/threonine protein kinase
MVTPLSLRPPLAAFPSLAAHPPQEGSISLVVEYMDGGSLQDIVDTGGCCDEGVLASISHRALSGLAFLHSKRQIHRDIKVRRSL